MRFYIAGKWEEREAVKGLMLALEWMGHSITVDWTIHETSDKGYPQQYAIDDVEGVKQCDVYVGRFINKNNYKGALVEMGIALGLDKQVWIIGHAIDSCIFTQYPGVLPFEGDDEVLSYAYQIIPEVKE